MSKHDHEPSHLSYLLFEVEGEKFGIDVRQVKDALSALEVTEVPHSRDKVYGVLNLRGRIVTVIDTGKILDLGHPDTRAPNEMYIVIEHEGEDYALLVNEVDDVIDLHEEQYPSVPRTLDSKWKDLAEGIDPNREKILLILSIPKLLSFIQDEDALQAN